MLYYSPSVKQCLDRKGKPWRATVYYVDATTNQKKQKTKMLKGASGKRDAQRMARIWLDELNAKAEQKANADKGKTVSEVIQEYEENRLSIGRIEKSSYKKDLTITKNYITPYLGDYFFSSVDRNDIEEWLTELFNRGLSSTTIRNAYAQLKKVYTYYYEREEIEKNPFKGIDAPKSGSGKKTHLTKEQMNAFISAVGSEFDSPKNAMFCGCYLACYGGLRRGEICGLRWRNINFENATITIDSAVGYGEGGGYTKPPKNNSSNRTFPMMPQLFEALKERYDYLQPKGNWFVIGDKEKFMSLQAFTNSFQKLADDYNLKDIYGKRITPHGLRHNFATVGIRSGMDIASLSLMLGHASRAMTLDTYGDANPDALKTASEKLALTFDDESNIAVSDETAKKLYKLEKKHRNQKETE